MNDIFNYSLNLDELATRKNEIKKLLINQFYFLCLVYLQ